MISIQNPDEIYSWNTSQLWNAINTLEEEELNREELQELHYIKWGYHFEAPIHYLIQEGWAKAYPHLKIVHIKSIGDIPIAIYMDERTIREKLMRNLINKYIKIEDPTIGR